MESSASNIIRIIADEACKERDDISLDDTLLGDLGVDGDDAWSIIERLHDEIGVDFSKFDFARHFRSEPCFKGPIYFFKRVAGQDRHMASGKAPITVGQLVEASTNGYWVNHV